MSHPRKMFISQKAILGLGKNTYFTNEAKSETYYTFQLKTRKSEYRIYPGTDMENPLGVAKIRWAKSIDCDIHGNSMKVLNSCGWASTKFRYHSPTLNQDLRWQAKSVLAIGDIVCLDEKENPILRYHPHWGLHNLGFIEFYEGVELEQDAVEELLLIGVAIANYKVAQSVVLTG